MPTSSYMPDVEVHIAFDSGYNTPAASRTWTDVSSYVELADRISIAFGRQDERSTADANSLSLTLDNTDGRFTAGRSASPYYPDVKIGRPIRVTAYLPANLVPNPSFEVNTTGWASLANCTVARSTAQAYIGSASMSMTAPAAGDCRASTLVGVSGFAVTAGLSYVGQARFRAATTPRSVGVELRWYDSVGVFISTTFGSTAADTTTGWTQVTATSTAPSNAVYGVLGARVVSAALGEVHYADAAMVEQASTASTYGDGSQDGWTWQGTAHQSTSLRASVRFVGFIDEWPVEWDGTDAYAMAKVRATSRLARLGLTAKLKSMIEEDILQDAPTEYYTLGDPTGSTAAVDSSGTGAARLSITGSGSALTFGSATGPPSDGLTALAIAGGEYLRYEGAATASGTAQSVSCFMLRTGLPSVIETVITTYSETGPAPGIRLRVLTTGVVEVSSTITAQVTGSVNVCDGSLHHVAVTRSGATWTLYVDGVVDATTGAGTSGAITTWTPAVGDYAFVITQTATPLTGTVAHAAFWSGTSLSAARVAAHAEAGASSGATTDERLLQILAWAGVASTEVTTETGDETMTYQQTSGQSVVDALRDVESTESGVLFDGRDGNVHFHNRSHRYQQTAAATLDMASQHVGADYAPKLDRSALVNDVEVSNPTTGEKARLVDTTSSDEYGIATASATSVADSYDPLQQKAAWLITSYAEPRMRVPSLTVDVVAHQGLTPSAQTLLGITVGDLLAVSNAPTQSDTTSPSYFIEGYTETIGPESYEISFNLSPTYPHLSVFIVDDATRGTLDEGNLLGL